MAAPETPSIKRLRVVVIVLAALLAAGVLAIGLIRTAIGAALTGAIFAALLVATLGFGLVYFVRKSRRDDAWLDQLIAEDRTT